MEFTEDDTYICIEKFNVSLTVHHELTIKNYQRDAPNIIYSSNIITLLYMSRASSTHLQEDIVVHKQHMVPSLSTRVLVACRYAARVRTDWREKVVGRAS